MPPFVLKGNRGGDRGTRGVSLRVSTWIDAAGIAGLAMAAAGLAAAWSRSAATGNLPTGVVILAAGIAAVRKYSHDVVMLAIVGLAGWLTLRRQGQVFVPVRRLTD
jgi:hypothetical protein